MLSIGSNIGVVKSTTWINGALHIHCVWPQEQELKKGKVRRWLADATYSEKEIQVLQWPEARKMEEFKPLLETIKAEIKLLIRPSEQ